MTTHNDIQRDLGLLEGGQKALDHRMSELEKLVAGNHKEIMDAINKVGTRLNTMETKAAEVRGGWKVTTVVAGLVSGAVAFVAKYVL